MEETPQEKCFLSGDSKSSSGMALAMFSLTMAAYGHKQTCCQIGNQYWLSFKSMQYKALGMKKNTTLYFKVASHSIL